MESSRCSSKTLKKGSCPYAPLDEALRYGREWGSSMELLVSAPQTCSSQTSVFNQLTPRSMEMCRWSIGYTRLDTLRVILILGSRAFTSAMTGPHLPTVDVWLASPCCVLTVCDESTPWAPSSWCSFCAESHPYCEWERKWKSMCRS